MRRSVITGLSLFVAACPPRQEDTDPEGAPSDDTEAACSGDDACDAGQICEASACEDGDRDNDVASATPMIWDDAVSGVINPAGDVDWYAITAEGGEFFRAFVVTAEADGGVDSVVSVYTEAGKRLAWEDEHPGGDVGGVDSALYAYFPEAGTYYVQVEDIGTFYGLDPVGGPDETYTLTVYDLGDGGDEPDSAQEAGFDYETVTTNTWYAVPVLVSEAGDVDYTAFELPDVGMPLWFVAGLNGEESDLSPVVTLINQDGATVTTLEEPTAEAPARLPEPQGTRYVLAAGDANGEGGPESWGWVYFIVREVDSGNPAGAEPNESVAEAEALELADQEPDSGRWYAGYRQAWLDVGDTDVYSFEVPFDDAYVTTSLGAQGYGSQLVARLEILDGAGTVVETVDSTADGDESARNLGPYPSGDYYLRVTSAEEGAGGEGYFYLFGQHVTSFQFD